MLIIRISTQSVALFLTNTERQKDCYKQTQSQPLPSTCTGKVTQFWPIRFQKIVGGGSGEAFTFLIKGNRYVWHYFFLLLPASNACLVAAAAAAILGPQGGNQEMLTQISLRKQTLANNCMPPQNYSVGKINSPFA